MGLTERFRALNCCVIIPTYNNDATLKTVIEEVLTYTDDLIVVNDGATDNTGKILRDFQDRIVIIGHPVNRGKGQAIRAAFAYARKKGYDHAITLDSDGQHFPSDLPLFFDALENKPGMLVIGSRNLAQKNVPGKSNFGNKFSNFWYWVETGIKLTDTQSGYRLYPIGRMEGTRYMTRGFAFEIEVIVKAAWKGIPVRNIPVHIHYEPPESRVSHFRPLRDFCRISLLNTYLVTLALLYYIPFRFIRSLSRENIQAFVRRQLFNKEEPPHIKAFSIGFGIFMGIFPVWGYQLIIGLAVSHLLRLNKALFVVAAHISIPPMIPVILYASYRLGGRLLPHPHNDILFSQGLTFEAVKENLVQYVLGAMSLAALAGLAAGTLSYLYFRGVRAKRIRKAL